MKKIRLVGGTLPPSTITHATGEQGQPAVEMLAKRKWDESVGMLGRKKSRAPMSLHALRQAARLTPLSPTKVPALGTNVPVTSGSTLCYVGG